MTKQKERIPISGCDFCKIFGQPTRCALSGVGKRSVTFSPNEDPVPVPGSIEQCLIRSRVQEGAILAGSFHRRVMRIRDESQIKFNRKIQ